MPLTLILAYPFPHSPFMLRSLKPPSSLSLLRSLYAEHPHPHSSLRNASHTHPQSTVGRGRRIAPARRASPPPSCWAVVLHAVPSPLHTEGREIENRAAIGGEETDGKGLARRVHAVPPPALGSDAACHRRELPCCCHRSCLFWRRWRRERKNAVEKGNVSCEPWAEEMLHPRCRWKSSMRRRRGLPRVGRRRRRLMPLSPSELAAVDDGKPKPSPAKGFRPPQVLLPEKGTASP
ncbi:uncharacterized protein [Arachis hypogaea]|uniref:uncharacterized protein n=1 Tax=Arachis hypogaea TaxID=3818 RepID=UPI000DED0FDD|nr:uncharacterized protein LOC112789638 [Arachis hypogaea]XP_025687393.1 uncharacterized protein LOC112789638 [Arachis hypogaea]XP_029151995.1 uncharacterized protein LOC112789638 [Arachis hypogaea]